MAQKSNDAKPREWADILVIVTGVILFGLALWPGLTATGGAAAEFPDAQFAWLAHGLAGLLAIGSVVVAQKRERRSIARMMLVVAAALLLAVFVTALQFNARAWLTLALPALLLLLASLRLGPMPPPAGVPEEPRRY